MARVTPRILTLMQATRNTRGWSQEDLGLHPEVRLEQTFISMIERGEALPTPSQAERLAKALGLTVETLLQPAIPEQQEQIER